MAVAVTTPEVPDALLPPPRNPRFPMLDGMRAVAALTVLTYHAAFFSGVHYDSFGGRLVAHLNVGVAIFFLISGFLLYRPFIAHRTGGPAPPTVRRYARRRLIRILPAYWLVLTVLIIVPGATGVVGHDWLAQYALLDNLPVGWHRGCSAMPFTCGLGQTWSLVVEMTFYVGLPLYVIAAAWLGRHASPRRWLRLELALLATLAVASVLVHFTGHPSLAFAATTLGFMFWFALGMGLAVVSVATGGIHLPVSPGWCWAAALATYVALTLYLPATPLIVARSDDLVQHLGFGLVALLLLLPAVSEARPGIPRSVLLHRPIAWLGLVSYGIFLWHYEIERELTADAHWTFVPVLLATVVLAVLFAAGSYYLVEKPLLRFKR